MELDIHYVILIIGMVILIAITLVLLLCIITVILSPFVALVVFMLDIIVDTFFHSETERSEAIVACYDKYHF